MSSEIAKRRSDELLSVLEGVAMDDARICKDAARALDLAPEKFEMLRLLDDDALKAAGWSRREFEAAWEARKPRSEAAYAVQLAHERTGMRIRQAQDRAGTTVNVANIIMPAAAQMTEAQRKKAPIVDVTPEEK